MTQVTSIQNIRSNFTTAIEDFKQEQWEFRPLYDIVHNIETVLNDNFKPTIKKKLFSTKVTPFCKIKVNKELIIDNNKWLLVNFVYNDSAYNTYILSIGQYGDYKDKVILIEPMSYCTSQMKSLYSYESGGFGISITKFFCEHNTISLAKLYSDIIRSHRSQLLKGLI